MSDQAVIIKFKYTESDLDVDAERRLESIAANKAISPSGGSGGF